uniref:Carbohydrate sulfotransferase n=1 Tax=Skeletonema marinoi TaxID=267567 RepID=A0A7S2KG62_9STRA|mmetsp:Transcript_12829/g.21746  ORF Transcript_12829/g.21746 Transcript_12829/m.21746 type:complete len:365 (+) Transcript_12829:157-1251(+)
MGALRQRRERDNISVTANTTTPILGRRRSSGSTISKLVLRIGTLVMIVAVPMLYNMPTPDLQTSSAQKQKNDVTVKKDTNDASSEYESPKRKGGEAKTNQEASEPSIAWEIMPAADHMDATIAELKPATLCACAKCGTTSLWEELFAIVEGKSFMSMNYTGPPFISKLSNRKLWTNIEAKRRTDWSNFKDQDSFALIRDPKERIVSAWKSKVTCDTDEEIPGHRMFVPRLLKLAGPSSNMTARTDKGFPCLDLSDYLAVLSQIHAQGREGSLNEHFLPQHLGCFKDVPPSMWTVVTTISGPNALCSLKSVVLKSANMSNMDDGCKMIKTHGRARSVDLSRADEVILDRITSKEYEMLGQYLNNA